VADTGQRTIRRRREIVTRADGTRHKIAKPPRADVLWYPRTSWPSVLVRRTHDLQLAEELALARWAEVADNRPLTGGNRIGWWTTYASKTVPDDAAIDHRNRVVRWCPDTTHGASPGIEFRP
jgi:hypothetical protein